MNKWRLWLGAGMGEIVSQELAAATIGLHGPEKRRARRLVRGGKAADDVAMAGYAIAFARERQRRISRSSLRFTIALGVVLGLGGMVASVSFLKRAVDPRAVAMLVFAAFFLVVSWRNWQTMRNIEAAERVNREYLRRSGAPYVPGGPPTRVCVPTPVVACGFAVRLLVAIAVGGLVTLALNGESLSFGKALSVGVWGGIGGTVGTVLANSSARSREDAALIEYLHARSGLTPSRLPRPPLTSMSEQRHG